MLFIVKELKEDSSKVFESSPKVTVKAVCDSMESLHAVISELEQSYQDYFKNNQEMAKIIEYSLSVEELKLNKVLL